MTNRHTRCPAENSFQLDWANNRYTHTIHFDTHLYCVIVVHVQLWHITCSPDIHLFRVLMIEENIGVIDFIFQCTTIFYIWFSGERRLINKLCPVGDVSVFENVIKCLNMSLPLQSILGLSLQPRHGVSSEVRLRTNKKSLERNFKMNKNRFISSLS